MAGPMIRKHDRTKEKMCTKCRKWRLIELYFGVHETASDGRQTICRDCKGGDNKKAMRKNVVARIRHHIASRCLVQLGDLAPPEFTKKLEGYLGYTVKELVRHLRKDLCEREGPERSLRDALNEGYHIDHKRPLSLFNPIMTGSKGIKFVDWQQFRACWRISNLTAIPAEENLKKGAKFTEAEAEGKQKESTEDGSPVKLSLGATNEKQSLDNTKQSLGATEGEEPVRFP